MIGLCPAMDVDYSGDDPDGPETEGNWDSVSEKFKEFSDKHLDDEIEKYKGYATGRKTGLKLRDEGAKFAICLRNLEKEKEARRIKRSLAADSTPELQKVDLHRRGPGTGEGLQTKCGTWPTSQPAFCRNLGACSTVETQSLSTKLPFHSPTGSALHEDCKSALPIHGEFTVSSEIIRQSLSPERRASSLERTTRVSSGEQAEPSSREFDQSESCIVCKKISRLSNVPGKEGLFCSVCRRKAKTPDSFFNLDNNLKTPAAKLVPRMTRKRAREADTVGRTPDSAMEIDSCDEDEKAQAGIGSALKGPSMGMPRRSGLRSTPRRRLDGYKVAFPSRTDPDAVEILPSDVQRLDPMEFLNDTVIDFYITYIQRDEFLGSEGRHRFHFFNSFFYKKLSEVVSTQKKKDGADFSKLRKWTKGTNVFEKDYLFVPIHDKLHWSLAIICFPGSDKGHNSERCIIHLDSMIHGHDSQRVFRLLRSYLVAEWKYSVEAGENEADECIHTVQSLKADNIPSKKVPMKPGLVSATLVSGGFRLQLNPASPDFLKVPLQDNESDCGLFLLHYIRKFVENAPKAMKLSDLEGNWDVLGVFGRNWFLSTEASSLRTSIQQQLYRLFNQEILDQVQANNQSASNGDTGGVCEVVLPLDGRAVCE